MKMEDEQSML